MADRVRDACEACFDANADDCSGFVSAVAIQLGIDLEGLADQIVDTIRHGNDWARLPDALAAAQNAALGQFVVAGLKGSEQAKPDLHGHVVVVDGPLADGRYPNAYWGRLGGGGRKHRTINSAWKAEDRDRVSYAAHKIT